MEKRKGYRAFITLCLAPAVILFLIFMVVPTVEVFRMSLFKRSAYSQTETFVGLQNFKILLTDPVKHCKNLLLQKRFAKIITGIHLITFTCEFIACSGKYKADIRIRFPYDPCDLDPC